MPDHVDCSVKLQTYADKRAAAEHAIAEAEEARQDVLACRDSLEASLRDAVSQPAPAAVPRMRVPRPTSMRGWAMLGAWSLVWVCGALVGGWFAHAEYAPEVNVNVEQSQAQAQTVNVEVYVDLMDKLRSTGDYRVIGDESRAVYDRAMRELERLDD